MVTECSPPNPAAWLGSAVHTPCAVDRASHACELEPIGGRCRVQYHADGPGSAAGPAESSLDGRAEG